MIKNMGSTDRMIRLLLGIVIVVAYLMGWVTGTAATILLILTAILLLTSFVGFCPAYYPFRISTRNKDASNVNQSL